MRASLRRYRRFPRRAAFLFIGSLIASFLLFPGGLVARAAYHDDPHSYTPVLKFQQSISNPYPGDGFRGGLDGIVSDSGVQLPPGHIYKLEIEYMDAWGGRITYYARNWRDSNCDGGFHFPIGEGSQKIGFMALVPYQGDFNNPLYICFNYHIGWQSQGIIVRIWDVWQNTAQTTPGGFSAELALDSQHAYPDNLYHYEYTATRPITIANTLEWAYHYDADLNAASIATDPTPATPADLSVQIAVTPPGATAGVVLQTNESRMFSDPGLYIIEIYATNGKPGIAEFTLDAGGPPASPTPTATTTATTTPPVCGDQQIADIGDPGGQTPPAGQPPPYSCRSPTPTPTIVVCGNGAGQGVQDVPTPLPPSDPDHPTPTPGGPASCATATPTSTPTICGGGAGQGVQDVNPPPNDPHPTDTPTPTNPPSNCVTPTASATPAPPTCPIGQFSHITIPQSPNWQIIPMDRSYIVFSSYNIVSVEYPYNAGTYHAIPATPITWGMVGTNGWYRFTTQDPSAVLAICNPTPTATPGDPFPTPIATLCVTVLPTIAGHTGPAPDLSMNLPPIVTAQSRITTTVQISITAIVGAVSGLHDQLATPAALIQTVTGQFTWANGQTAANGMITYLQPGLNWLAILNPENPAYVTTGGPLWALAPVLRPILPIVISTLLVSFVRLIIWCITIIVSIIETVFKIAAVFA